MNKGLTFDAVDEVITGDDVEVILEELDDAVGGHVTAAPGHEDGLAGSCHYAVDIRLKLISFIINL